MSFNKISNCTCIVWNLSIQSISL